MHFDPDRLLRWQVPHRTHVVTRREVAFYALSVGLGREATNRDMLRFVDPTSPDLTALPSMALVLGYPGFWLADPGLGLDSRRILHAEQSVEIVDRIPVEGSVTGRTRILEIVDRGLDKGMLLYSERLVHDDKDRVFARLLQTHLLRGVGGYGMAQATTRPRPAASNGRVVERARLAVRPEQALMYRLNGDFNPIHSDPIDAARAGFSKPILHGMCTFGMVSWIVGSALSGGKPERLTAISARFSGPVEPGETLLTEIRDDGSFRTVAEEREAVVVDFGTARTEPVPDTGRVISHAL